MTITAGPREKLLAAGLSAVCGMFLVEGLRTGRVVGPAFMADASRLERPRAYWTALAVWGLLFLACLPVLFST